MTLQSSCKVVVQRCWHSQTAGLQSVVRRHQRATFWRGGTSNGIVIAGHDLPEWQTIRTNYPDGILDLKECATLLAPLYQIMMGSPDPYGRQLNGMGGGISSLSKAVIVDKSSLNGCDLDYLFIQIGIKDGKLDLAGNCGNMSATVAPFGLNERLFNVKQRTRADADSAHIPMRVRLRNLNTRKIIDADIFTSLPKDKNHGLCFESRGDYILDGVAGYASPITLSFVSPGGAKTGKALPTGNYIDTVKYAPGQSIRASLLDISNPGVFIDGRAIGWDLCGTPEQLNANMALMAELEAIRRAGAEVMGMDPETPSIPKIVLLFPPRSEDEDIVCQALSMEQAHKAIPMTLGLNLAVACKMPGTIAYQLARHRSKDKTIISHPSGRVEVGADISQFGEIISAKVIRTARMLMEGYVNLTPLERFELSAS